MKLLCLATGVCIVSMCFCFVVNGDGLERAKPEEAGMSAEKLAKVKTVMERLVDRKRLAGAVVVVARRGKIVFAEAVGQQNRDGRPMKIDSILRFYSMTKPITSTAIMMLVEEGKIGLDDPVSKHIPSFKNLKVLTADKGDESDEESLDENRLAAPKREMTVRDLLRHTSGLTYGFFGDSAVDKIYQKKGVLGRGDSLNDTINKLKDIPLLYHPGEKWGYSVATDVLGYIVEKVSGQRLDKFFEKRIFKPLEMKDTAFYVPEQKRQRFADNYGPDSDKDQLRVIDDAKESRYLKPPTLYSGGGGLVSTATDYIRFCQMMLNQGQLDGVRLLKSETVKQMTTNQLDRKTFPIALSGGARPGVGFGLGFSVIAEKNRLAPYVPLGEYGWGGAASTHFWISPQHELAVVALTQHMPFSLQLEFAVKPLVYAAIGE